MMRKEFYSLHQADRETGISFKSIHQIANKRRDAKKSPYIWRFVDDVIVDKQTNLIQRYINE